ncbi:MAG: hypothetical protein ACKV19_26300 [Verrucomicrobiales bacterium]
MYFEDLSHYSYGLPRPLEDVINIGWLDVSHDFPTGLVPNALNHRLRFWLGRATVNRIRGYHECNICGLLERQRVQVNGQTFLLGAAEIWIPTESGRVFAAPDLLLHYIEGHAYKPPDEFIAAALDHSFDQDWNAERIFEKRVMAAFG